MEPEKLREFVSENRELELKLTKRNQQYIFDLNKSMKAANLSEEEQVTALHDILPALVEGQKQGTTARQLYGTVSECMDSIINKPAEANPKPVFVWLDNFLLLFGMFLVIMGGMAVFVKQAAETQYGITTLLVGSSVGGWVMYLMYKYFYQYDLPGADRSQKPKLRKSMPILIMAVLLWFFVFMGSVLLPRIINPILDPVIMVAIGAVALLIRHFLKKKYNITGTFGRPAAEPEQSKKK